jgi:hypothetical protein
VQLRHQGQLRPEPEERIQTVKKLIVLVAIIGFAAFAISKFAAGRDEGLA